MKAALAALALFCLSACTVGPDFERQAPPDANQGYQVLGEAGPSHSGAGQRIRGDWWRLFGSADLDDVVVLAMARNQDMVAARATLAQIQQQARATAGVYYPQLGLQGAATREKVNFTSFGLDFPSNTLNLYSVGATVFYALDLFGHDRRMVEAADAAAEAEGYRLKGAILTVTGTLVMRAFDAAALDSQIALISALTEEDQRQLDLLRSARQAGTVSDRTLAEAEGQLASDFALLPALRSQLAAIRHDMAVLVGKTPGEWSPPGFTTTSFSLPADIPVSVPSDLVRQRPDILAAEADLHASAAAIGMAEANRFPRLMLTADITQWATRPGQLWRDAATGAGVSGGITAPLFQGGQLEAAQSAAEHAYQASLARYRQTVLQAFAQVGTLLQGLAQDEEQRRQTGLAAKASDQALHFAELERSSGTQGVLPLLAAERQAKLSRLAVIRSQAQILKDTAGLFLAMGGGTLVRPNPSNERAMDMETPFALPPSD